MIKEYLRGTAPGLAVLPVMLLVVAGCLGVLMGQASSHQPPDGGMIAGAVVVLVLDAVCLGGCMVIGPNEGRVLQLFGSYAGTARTAGLRWTNPFYSKKRISLRARNFETAHIKVNDHDGNPIEIAAVIVWRVVDTAEATFEVEDYRNYVQVQSDSAIRNLASQYPYDAHNADQLSLRGNTQDVADQLKREIQERLAKAGVEVMESRISHLAYAPEIAQVMLRRQQASAIIAARQKIVEGAVTMVEMALEMLSEKKVVEFDNDRKAAMVSNLMVVLCGEREAQPIVNAGTIYQ
jgi:regulator of protease activity HflC (stomatin/prohibitin superfamily)